LQKRFSQGYTIQASYTWSKWIQATEYLNAADAAPTRMISDQDSPHRFSMSGMFALPFGKGKTLLSNANGVVDRIVGGWQLGGVYSFQIGFPIGFTNDLFYNGGNIALPANQRTTDRWFNTDVFTSLFNATSTNATPANHLRTLPFRFTDVRRDNINNVDLSLLKDTKIREGMKIQIRFELVNAFNEPYFPAPTINPSATRQITVNGVLTTVPAFGVIAPSNQDNYARRAQFGIKFLF
jgi:hypothetical protein